MIEVEKDEVCRQGDVLLSKDCELPADCELVTEGSQLTIAYGEVTGHHHTLYPLKQQGLQAEQILVREFKQKSTGDRYVQILEKMNLRHPEHDPEVNYKVLKPSVRKIIIEQEENPFLDEIEAVKD